MMFDFVKKRKIRRIGLQYSMMPFKKEKRKSSLFSCFRMHNKKKKVIVYEMSDDDKLRSKTNEDCISLNKKEQSSTGMRCNETLEFGSLQATESPISLGANEVTLKKKQNNQSFEDYGRVNDLNKCERTTMFSCQDNHQTCLQVIIDHATCRITVYSDATYEIEDGARTVENNDKKYNKIGHSKTFMLNVCEVEKRKDVQKAFQTNICRPERNEDMDEICNQKPIIILPTRHHTSTVAVVKPLFVERNTLEVNESTAVNYNENTVVETDEADNFCNPHDSLNMEPDPESQSDDTFVKCMDWSSSTSSRSFEDNGTNVPSLQENDNTFLEESNWTSFDLFSTAGQEMVQKIDGRTCFINDNYSENQKSRNENKKDALAGIHRFCQTDAQHQDIHDNDLVHGVHDPQESCNFPHSVRVDSPHEGTNAWCDQQMLSQLDHEMKFSSKYDQSDSCIAHMTKAKLVEKVHHLESLIGSLYRLDMFAIRSNSRIPGIMKKQDLVISECQENCRVYLNDDDIMSPITGNLLQVTSLPDNSFINPECQEHNGHCSNSCTCLAYNSFLDLESPQYSKVQQVSPPTQFNIFAEEMNSTGSVSMDQGEAMKTEKVQKIPDDLKISESANQPMAMCMVNRPIWDIGEESDEIGHALSLQINLSENSLHHDMDLKENLEWQTKINSFVAELNKIKFSSGERKYSSEEIIAECQENGQANLNDDGIRNHVDRDLFKVISLPGNSVYSPKCQEQTRLWRSASLCLIYNTLNLKSQKHNRVGKVSQATGVKIHAEQMNRSWSANTTGKEAKKTKMQKIPKALERDKPAEQPIGILEKSVWDIGAESDEIGHTLSLQRDQSGGNGQKNWNFKQSLKGQAETRQLVELNEFKSSRGERYCKFSEKITVEMDDAMNHGPDSLQLKEKHHNNNEAKSSCLSEAILILPIIIGHTNRTPVENIENGAQVEITDNSRTTECIRLVGSIGYGGKDYTDTKSIPRMDSKLTFINNDPNILYERESVKGQVWNNQNIKRNENAASTSKLTLEAADNTDNSKETDCCPNVNADDVNYLHQIYSNIDPIKTNPFKFLPEIGPVTSDPENIPGHDLSTQHEECKQREALVCYYCDHSLQVKHLSKEKSNGESQSIQDSEPDKPGANEFVSESKVQEGKYKETKSVLNKMKPLRRSKSSVRYRLCSLRRRRRGKKGKVKLRKSINLTKKVSHAEKLPESLSDLKILLHYLASSFAQDMAPADAFTPTALVRKEKTDFAAELGIVVSEKENSTQEGLIDDFLKSLVSTWFIFPTITNGLQSVILLPTGLQLYFERLLRGTPPEERERMSYEWLRLQTFISYPASAPGSGIRLARAGFYYSGNGTVTVCYSCGGQHSGWNLHDDPYEIHRRISPDCPFLRGNPTYPNVPIMLEGERIGIQMGSNTSDTSLSQTLNLTMVNSPSSSNRTSDKLPPTAFQLQNSVINHAVAQSSAAAMPSIHNSQERGSEQQALQHTMSEVELLVGIIPSSITPASSAHVDEILPVLHQPVTPTVEVGPNTIGESLQGQPPPPAASNLTQPQQPTDDAENTQYRNPGNFELIKSPGQVEDPGVDPTPQTMSERPRHPEYAPLSSRVNSYTGWPVRLDQTPQQMAEAGFFYAGINDYTRCFHCGGGLRNWEPGDNPWIEHARWYPQCAYVLGKRGQKFVNAVLKKQAELLAAQNAERNNSNTINTTSNISSIAVSKTHTQSAQVPATQTGQTRYFQNPKENEIANRLINEMGYQRERVREAILEVKRSRGQQEIAVEHVIELLIADEEGRAGPGRQNDAATVEELIQESRRLTLHDDCNPQPAIPPAAVKATATTTQQSPLNQVAGNRFSGQQQNGQKSGQTNQTSASGRAPSVQQSQLNMSGPMSIAVDVPSSSSIFNNRESSQNNKSSASNRPLSSPLMEPTSLPAFDAESLREEYLRLRDQNMCKICMERIVELAFLPCGHLVCCEVCGQTLRFCPICRAKIHASLKTYLS